MAGQLKTVSESEFQVDFEWEIEGVLCFLKESKTLQSLSIDFLHCNWLLEMSVRHQERLQLYLQKNKSEIQVAVMFKLGIRLADGTTEMRCCLTKKFESLEASFGTREFILTSELEERKNQLLPADTLTIACTVCCLNAVTLPPMFSCKSKC